MDDFWLSSRGGLASLRSGFAGWTNCIPRIVLDFPSLHAARDVKGLFTLCTYSRLHRLVFAFIAVFVKRRYPIMLAVRTCFCGPPRPLEVSREHFQPFWIFRFDCPIDKHLLIFAQGVQPENDVIAFSLYAMIAFFMEGVPKIGFICQMRPNPSKNLARCTLTCIFLSMGIRKDSRSNIFCRIGCATNMGIGLLPGQHNGEQ